MEADSAGADKHFVCDYCPKKYLRKNNLEDHILMEHPDTEQATEIIQHKARNGRSKGSLIIQCEICSKRFRYQSDLKNHYESHFRGRARGTRGVSSGRGGARGGGAATSPRGGHRPQPYRANNQAVVSSTRGEKSDEGYRPPAPQYNRTRPCLYCGKTFLSRSDLQDHEETEATEFEKEAVHFESENRMKMGQPTFESYSPYGLNHVIDRTDEEFGDSYSFPKNLKIKGRDPNDFRSTNHSAYTNHINQTHLTNGSSPVCNKVASIDNVINDRPISLIKDQYNNHTSQYTSLDPVCPLYQGTTTPPPAHEDQTIAHGFFPPPPPLPVPQFTQICHKRSDAEFADPNEDKTYTTLQSNDESCTQSSLLQVDSMSPSREVLDLSLPKTEVGEAEMKVEPKPKAEEKVEEDEVVDYSVKPDSSQPKQVVVDHFTDTTPPLKEEVKDDLKEELIIFEPSSMPSMPEAVLSFGETKLALDHEETNISDADFKYLSDEYSGLMNPDDDLESFRSQSPLQFDDPNRIDCKFCGMVFTAPHVRKFHEQGHNEEQEEYGGELTRLFCGFCGKVFKKATYRMLHEKGHTGELAICCQYCERKFRWESELRSHHKMCTAENPAKPQNKRPKFQSTPKHTPKDDWIENHPSMPTGWKLRTRPRPTQEGQLYFIFLSPEGQVFHSRKAVLQHMEKTGGYSVEDINKVRKSAKTGPRGRGGRGGGASRRDRSFSDMDLDLDESNLDSSDLDPPYTPSKKPETDAVVEGNTSSSFKWDEDSLPAGWRVRSSLQPSGELKFEFLSPTNLLLTSRKDVLNHLKKKKSETVEPEEQADEERKQGEFKKWADIKMRQFRRKMPKRKRLVSNQVLVNSKVKAMRREFQLAAAAAEEPAATDLFRHEPVVFVPRLLSIVKNMDLKEALDTYVTSHISIPINCIHSDEGMRNNVEEMKEELRSRQLHYDKKLSDDEEEEDQPNEQRHLRFTLRRNYQENDDDLFQELLTKGKGSKDTSRHPEDRSDDEEVGETKGKERNRFLESETKLLEKWFDKNPYPNKDERTLISELMNLPEKKVRIWFQNKRCKTDDGKMKCFFARNNISTPDSGMEEDDLHTCSACSQTFVSKLDFKIHCKRVHGTDGEKIVCKDCLKTFDTLWNLKTHNIEEHSKTGENYIDPEFLPNTADEGGRTKFSKYQIVGLRNAFAANPYPDKEGYRNISERLNISNKTLHSWFQNHRHREKIQSKYSEQVDHLEDELAEDDDSRTPYNPGHKKTKFSDHQRYYLQSFFTEKEYVDEDDISDLSAELMLSPKVIRIWFQHARERKKKNLPILPSRGRGRGRGSSRGLCPSDRPRGRPRLGRPPKIREPSGLEDLYDIDDESVSEDLSRKSLEDGKASVKVPPSNAKEFTEFQKVFLGDFYKNIQNPDSDDLDYICEHVNATRPQIIEWFENRNKNNPLNQSESVKICSNILMEVIDGLRDSLQPQDVSSVRLESSFSCPYCGISFPEEHLLKEHEKIEAIEFEKEALKFKEETKVEDNTYVTLGDNSEDWSTADLEEAEMFDDDDEDNEFFSGEDSRDHFASQDSSQYVKRPLNPFMIWLQEERKKLSGESSVDRTSRSTGELVKDLSVVWKSMSEFDKMPYIEESRRLKEIHKREHPNYIFTPTKKKPSSTPKSGVKYARRANLVKSYICKRCQVGFTTKGNLFKHLRNFHPDSPYDPKYYELGNERSEERNLKKCEHCTMVFISKIGLGRHMLRVHNDSRKYDGLYTEDSAGDADRFDAKRGSTSPRAYGLNYSEPVSSSSDGYYQNPSDDDFTYEKKVHVKTRFTAYQRRVLMDSFHSSISMTKCDAKKLYFRLADTLQLPAKIVRIWFQNARSARKRGKPIFSDV